MLNFYLCYKKPYRFHTKKDRHLSHLVYNTYYNEVYIAFYNAIVGAAHHF